MDPHRLLHGIRAHRVGQLRADEVTVLDRVPITTPARTLLDLARVAGSRDLERAVARALRCELTTHGKLAELVDRYPKRRGVPALRALLRGDGGPDFTRSPAEDQFRELVSKAKLPAPATNQLVAGHEVDVVWPAGRVVVEVDGFAYHRTRSTFEKDRERDAELAAAGYRVLRVTWQQLAEEPTAVVARVAQSLARSGRR